MERKWVLVGPFMCVFNCGLVEFNVIKCPFTTTECKHYFCQLLFYNTQLIFYVLSLLNTAPVMCIYQGFNFLGLARSNVLPSLLFKPQLTINYGCKNV